MPRRVGVIGCGRWGSKHLESLRTLADEAEIECIVACDVDVSVLDSIQHQDIALHDNPKTLVERFGLDAVIIATRMRHITIWEGSSWVKALMSSWKSLLLQRLITLPLSYQHRFKKERF